MVSFETVLTSLLLPGASQKMLLSQLTNLGDLLVMPIDTLPCQYLQSRERCWRINRTGPFQSPNQHRIRAHAQSQHCDGD